MNKGSHFYTKTSFNNTLIIFLIWLKFGCGDHSKLKPELTQKANLPIEILGERKKISGDFNGDGKMDTLKESFISTITGKETNKYYQNLEYDSMVSLIVRKKPLSKLTSSSLNPLILESDSWQLFGIALLQNLGDMNNDGNDELGLVIDYADWSSVNTYYIYSYIDNGWKILYHFEIRDGDLEDVEQSGEFGFLFKDQNGDWKANTYKEGEKVSLKIKL